jgi:hypothetical protein
MQIKETLDVSFPGAVESPALEDVVVLADSAGVALGVQRTFSARVRSVRDDGSGLTAFRCVEIPLVGSEGEVSGILCHTGPRSDTRGAVAARERERVRAIGDMAHPDITVRTEIAPDLRYFDADPEELYFAVLILCRNAADALPEGGAITVAARNVEPSAGAAREFVAIVVADGGEGMTEKVLSQAFTPYFTTKPAGSGTVLGLAQVQRFAEGRGGAVRIERERGAGALVRLFLPRAHVGGVPSSLAGTEIAYTPSPSGGVFHVVNPATAAPTS